ncbi:hypothetical protein KQI41_01255 [Tissierella pigra]|uniref:hypothetical protein n=1 Tax=Tissierella pigra TaxID=2607614 RepID=UPI001C0FDD28|nr:hypothetical protein [Tissierella pigra]MBU5425023.1 hypothetical protein [Tissierella pigra]
MIEKITLDMLTQDSVSVKKQQYVVQEGKEYAIGDIWRRAYVNSLQGRQQIQEEVTEPYKSVVLLMWGDNPTIVEEIN